MSSRGRRGLLLVAFVALLVNLPYLHSTYQHWQVERSGVVRTATITESRVLHDDEYYLEYSFDPDTPAGRGEFAARVDGSTYDRAVDRGTLQVRVLPDDDRARIVPGEVRSRASLVITVLADLALLGVALLLWRHRGSLRPRLVLRAERDLERCPPGNRLERVDEGRYVACGEILTIGADSVVLDVGDRQVEVLLDGHHNPADQQQPVRATGFLIA